MARDYTRSWIQVTFEPDGTRDVFARDCYCSNRHIETYTNRGNPSLAIAPALSSVIDGDRLTIIFSPAQARQVIASLEHWLCEHDTPIPASGEAMPKESADAPGRT